MWRRGAQGIPNKPGGIVPGARTLTAGDGLTGGGDLTADRTFDVVAHADGSITVNADDIQVGVLATDTQHGARGRGTQHTDVVAGDPGESGFMDGARALKLDGVEAGATADQTITAGSGLTGGGTGDVTLDAAANADGSIVVNDNDIQVGVITDPQHGDQPLGDGLFHAVVTALVNGFMSFADKAILDLIGTPQYGGIAVEATQTAQTGIDQTFQVVDNWEMDQPSSSGITPAFGSNTITIGASVTGTFRVAFTIVFLGSNNREYTFEVFLDGEGIACSPAPEGTGANPVTATFSGCFIIVTGASPKVFDIRVTVDSGTQTFVFKSGTFTVDRISTAVV